MWGRGYATEAACASLDWCFATIDRPYFTAMIRPDNARSITVAERLGMSVIRDDVLLGDPVQVFAISRAR